MAADLTTDAGLLADVHTLQSQGVGHPDVGGDAGQLLRVGEISEDVIEVVHGMTDLVDAQLLRLA